MADFVEDGIADLFFNYLRIIPVCHDNGTGEDTDFIREDTMVVCAFGLGNTVVETEKMRIGGIGPDFNNHFNVIHEFPKLRRDAIKGFRNQHFKFPQCHPTIVPALTENVS